MRLLIAALLIASTTANAQDGGFFGGMADGMRSAQEHRAQERAIENDRRYGTATYESLRLRQSTDAMRRELEAQQREIERMNRQLERLRSQSPMPH